MVKEVASKTSDMAGDGTTTATILAQAIYREGSKLVAAGHNPMALKRGIDKAVETVVEELKKLSKPTQEQKEIAQVGTISANNDTAIGNIIAEAMNKVGKEGVITVEEAKSMETILDVVEGCSSTAATYRPTLSPIRSGWRCAGGAVSPYPREEGQQHEGPASDPGANRPDEQAALDCRRGCGG